MTFIINIPWPHYLNTTFAVNKVLIYVNIIEIYIFLIWIYYNVMLILC